jgi:hypothetical protein
VCHGRSLCVQCQICFGCEHRKDQDLVKGRAIVTPDIDTLSGCVIKGLTGFAALARLSSGRGRPTQVSITGFHIPTEVRKALKGKKTKADLHSLFHAIAPEYLQMLKVAEAQSDEQKDVDKLERMFRLEDPRR